MARRRWIVFAVSLVGLLVVLLVPSAWLGPLPLRAPMAHGLAFFGVALLWGYVTPADRYRKAGFLLLPALAVVTELAQIPVPSRNFSWGDIGADLLGLGLGFGVGISAQTTLRGLRAISRNAALKGQASPVALQHWARQSAARSHKGR